MKNTKALLLMLIPALLSLLLAACSGAAVPTTMPTSTATAAPTTVSTTTPTSTSTPSGGFPVGQYEPEQKFGADWISFKANGTYVIALTPREIPGKYVVNGDKIVLNEDSGLCLNHPGTYSWEIHGNVLTLKAIDDQCTASERAKDLSRDWDLTP